MVRPYGYIAVIGLAGAIALFCGFQSVCNCIPDKMDQWIGDLLNDAVVQLRFGARKIEFN